MRQGIVGATAIMMTTFVASRFLGWLRLSVIGAYFGLSKELDAFWAANVIPESLFNLIVAGAITSASFTVFLSPFLGIYALAWGVVVGALMMFLVQVPELTFRRTRYSLTLDLGHPGLREIATLTAPRALAQGSAFFVIPAVNTALATGLVSGSLSALNYAFALMLLPLGVFS